VRRWVTDKNGPRFKQSPPPLWCEAGWVPFPLLESRSSFFGGSKWASISTLTAPCRDSPRPLRCTHALAWKPPPNHRVDGGASGLSSSIDGPHSERGRKREEGGKKGGEEGGREGGRERSRNSQSQPPTLPNNGAQPKFHTLGVKEGRQGKVLDRERDTHTAASDSLTKDFDERVDRISGTLVID
jgi:hypothetical protein